MKPIRMLHRILLCHLPLCVLIGCATPNDDTIDESSVRGALNTAGPVPTCSPWHKADPLGRCRGQSDFISGRLTAYRGPMYAEPTKVAEETSREVVESDVYRLVNETLYILNQYRGLQIVDVANADAPRLVGRAEIPGYPREMYIDTPRNKAYVLVSDAPQYDKEANAFTESQLAVVDLESPATYKSFQIPGYIVESRQVGDVIYVVSNEWRFDETSGMSASFTTVKSIDIAGEAEPRLVTSMELEGNSYQIHASSEYLLIANSHGWEEAGSTIRALDIRDPKGQILELNKLWIPGEVRDRFQMNIDSNRDVLRVVSNDWRTNSIHVNTFSMPQGKPLGELDLLNVGQLLATKFDGDKAYIVHIERVDPLDVIDLSNPARPVRLSSLEIPGWLENLEILGDRVIGIGYDSGHVAVALYDVSDPTNTFELDRVFLGNGASWSSTNHWDTRTFKLLSDQNLLLVPFSLYDRNRSYQAIQLIDLDLDAGRVRSRGRVDQAGMAVRSFELDSRIGSFTDRKFTTANIDNRDKPYITGDVELARHIIGYTKVRGAGLQLVAEWDQPAELRAVPLSNPDAEVFDAYSRFPLKRADHVYSTGSHAIVARRDWNESTGMPVVTLQAIDYRNPWKPIPAGEIEIEMLDPVYGYESGAAEPRDVLQITPTGFLVLHRGKETYHARLISFANPSRPVFVDKTDVPVIGELVEARVVGSALYLTSFDSIFEESSDDDPSTSPDESAAKKMLPPWWHTSPQKGRYYATRVAVFSRSLEASYPVNIPGLFVDVDAWGRLIVLDSRILDGENIAIDKALSTLTIRFSPATSPKWTTRGAAVLRDLLDIDDSVNTALVRGDMVYYTTTQNQGGYAGPWAPWSIGSDWTLHAVELFGTRLFEKGEILLQKNGSGAILDIQPVGLYTYAFVNLSGHGVAVFDLTDAFSMNLYQYIPSQSCYGEVLIDPRASFGYGDATISCGLSGIKSLFLPRF